MTRPGGLFFALGLLLIPAILGAAVDLGDLGALLGLIRLGGGLPGLPLQLVQLGQAAAQGVPLLGIQGGHLLVKPLVLAAPGVLLKLLLELLTVLFALGPITLALGGPPLAGCSALLAAQGRPAHACKGGGGQGLA